MYIISALNAMQSSSLAGSVTMRFGICKNNYQLQNAYFYTNGKRIFIDSKGVYPEEEEKKFREI